MTVPLVRIAGVEVVDVVVEKSNIEPKGHASPSEITSTSKR